MKYFSKINKISRQDNDDNMNLNEDSKQKSSITDRCVKLCISISNNKVLQSPLLNSTKWPLIMGMKVMLSTKWFQLSTAAAPELRAFMDKRTP